MSRISIGFLGNMYFDTRTYNLFHSLKSKGHSVVFYGFDWDTPDFRSIRKNNVRIRRLKKRRFSIFYYMRFAIELLVQLILHRSDVYIASDFYALPFSTFAARFWGTKLIYDSREIYSELPAFHRKSLLKKMVLILERLCIKSTRAVLTTGAMDSIYLKKLYGLRNTILLRNLPLQKKVTQKMDYADRLSFEATGRVLIYQGILVPGRGIETAFEVLQRLPDYRLVLLGEGSFNSYYYKKMSKSLGIQDRVFFAGRVSQNELIRYTAGGDIGLSLIENLCDNNYYALPNKLFEYVMSGLPVIVTDMPQMKAVVDQYHIGAVVPEKNAGAVVEILLKWDSHPSLFQSIRRNCIRASKILNWETEFGKIDDRLFHF